MDYQFVNKHTIKTADIPSEIIMYYHTGCNHGHFRIGAMRRCAGRYVHLDEQTRVVYTRKVEK